MTAAQLLEVEDRVVALFEADRCRPGELRLPAREVVLGYPVVGQPLPGASVRAGMSVPMGPADRYAVLATPSAADRWSAGDAGSVAAMVEFG